MRLRLVAFVCLGALFACGCSGKDSSEPAEFRKIVDLRTKTTGVYPEVQVVVKDNNFTPSAIRVNPGTEVVWTNEGRSPHDIVPADPKQRFGVDSAQFKPDSTYDFAFAEPGVYRYFCSLHGSKNKGMIGEVVVGDVDASTGKPLGDVVEQRSGTLRVPKDYPTIQGAVDAAKPGGLVLVSPGVYKEAVTVTTADIVIRGVDRARTVLDGEFTRDNGIKVLADGVAIENMTARNFKLNGFFWTGVDGYRGSYLNAIRNGDYGIYAFDATHGQFDHDYGAGSPDAGFYIGQCFPCDAVITDSLAEWNGIGYSGTNAGGNLLIVRSVWHDNRVGIVPNSGTGEANPPEHDTTIVGNTVYSNNNDKTAAIDIAQLAIGTGILVAGGNANIVERNLVYDHDLVGIGVIPLPEQVIDPTNPKAVNFDARENRVEGNAVSNSGAADLALVTSLDDENDAGGNCFSGNTFATSLPRRLEELAPCTGAASPDFKTDLGRFAELLIATKPGPNDYMKVALPEPPDLPNMPNAEHAAAQPAGRGVPLKVDLASIVLPKRRG